MRKSLANLVPLAAFACFVGFFALAAAWPILHEGKKAYTLEEKRSLELALVKLQLVKQYDESTEQQRINKENQLAIADARVKMTRYKLSDAVVQVGETARQFYWLGLFSGLGVIVSYRMTRPARQRNEDEATEEVTEEVTQQPMVAVAC